MEERTGLLFLVVLISAWVCDARELALPDLWRNNPAKSDYSELAKKQDVCALCEEYITDTLDFLTKNKTQDEIIDILYHTCHKLHPLEPQCLNLVDHYAPLFFSELASIQPGELCKKAHLCQQIAKISSQVQEDSCGFCRDAVSELLVKLKDPDTEFSNFTVLKFGGPFHMRRCKIAEIPVEKNFDLAFQVIYEFNLPAVDIYAGVAASLAVVNKN